MKRLAAILLFLAASPATGREAVHMVNKRTLACPEPQIIFWQITSQNDMER